MRHDRRAGRARSLGRAAVGAALVVPLAFRPAFAQPSPASRTQSEVERVRLTVDLFFRAVADERWDTAAAMVDTIAIRRMVAGRLRWRQPPVPREMTIEDFMRDDPNKPRAVAEYELKRFRERSAKFAADPVSYEFAGVGSADELGLLSAREATARYLEAQDVRAQLRAMARRSGCPTATATMPFAFHRILAVALATDTVAYTLHDDGFFTSRSDGVWPAEPMVMQLRLRGGTWQIIPGNGLLRRSGMMGFGLMQCDSHGAPAARVTPRGLVPNGP